MCFNKHHAWIMLENSMLGYQDDSGAGPTSCGESDPARDRGCYPTCSRLGHLPPSAGGPLLHDPYDPHGRRAVPILHHDTGACSQDRSPTASSSCPRRFQTGTSVPPATRYSQTTPLCDTVLSSAALTPLPSSWPPHVSASQFYRSLVMQKYCRTRRRIAVCPPWSAGGCRGPGVGDGRDNERNFDGGCLGAASRPEPGRRRHHGGGGRRFRHCAALHSATGARCAGSISLAWTCWSHFVRPCSSL